MADNIDSLQIEISADATKADDALEKLSKSISALSSSLGGMQTSKLYQLADGMSKFAGYFVKHHFIDGFKAGKESSRYV